MPGPFVGRAPASMLALLLGLSGASTPAHEAGFTRAEMAPLGAGRLQITLAADARLVLPGMHPDAWAGALVVRFDGHPVPLAVDLPRAVNETGETVDIVFTATVPPGAGRVTLQGSALFGPLVIRIAGTGDDTRRFVAAPGRESNAVPLEGPLAVGRGRTLLEFVALGYRHILPDGLDHVLFVLGLCLAGSGWRSLLLQATAFTVAHSTTLAIAAWGILTLPARLVEPLIAVSIAWVAVENLLREAPTSRRLALVFGFGLLHGLGFAGALATAGLGGGGILLPLLGFNVGVELGQLTVIAAALGLGAPFAARAWFRPWILRPASAAIALVGVWWAVTRTWA